MDFQSRIRNKAFWVSVAAFIALMGKTFNLFEVPTNYDTLVTMFLGILTAGGILIDPTSPGVKDYGR